MTVFWEELGSAKLISLKLGFLLNIKNETFPIVKQSSLYIRRCYIDTVIKFFDAKIFQTENDIAAGGPDYLILGTPGIGKSAFGVFLLWLAKLTDVPVLYRHTRTLYYTYNFCFTSCVGQDNPYGLFIDDPQIKESKIEINVKSFHIGISSDNQDRYSDFLKDHVKRVIHWIWTREEMEEANIVFLFLLFFVISIS